MTDVDLTFLARQIERLLANDARQADDMRVLTAIVMRLDNTRDRHDSLLRDDSLVLRYLREIDVKLDRQSERLDALTARVAALEGAISSLVTAVTGVQGRLDLIETRLERIERRLGLIETT